jgi:hypothetical protein
MMVLHGVCTGHVHREGTKTDAKGEKRDWVLDFFNVFDGQTVRECRLSDEFGDLAVGEVITASVALDAFRDQVQVRLVQRVDESSVKAFTPELAQLLLSAGMMQATNADAKPSRAA